MNGLKAELGPGAAHLCIDMQRLFSREGPWPTPWMERVLPMVIRLVERSPVRTVFTRFLTPATPEDMPGMWRVYYHKWAELTRSRIDPTTLDLMPELICAACRHLRQNGLFGIRERRAKCISI
jgi:nicotinamidase-related amidase